MPKRLIRGIIIILAVIGMAACAVSASQAIPSDGNTPPPHVVVTTSLLASAVRDLSGNTFTIETLMPAGTCPGQFDLDPGQAKRVRSATLVLRHERQAFLDTRFAAAGVPSTAIAFPKSPGLWTIPDVYARYCRLIAAEITKRLPAKKESIDTRLAALEDDMRKLGQSVKKAAEPLRGTRVLAAQFQTEFLSWLGLEVVGSFPPTDDPSPALIRTTIALAREKRAVLIVGNIQSGERLPATLASSLGLPLAMLSNFPAEAKEGAIAPLANDNLRRLFDALARPVGNSP